METMTRLEFNQVGDFKAFDAAVSLLQENGFSVGSMQRDDPIGLMYGDYDISKWRNLNEAERNGLHGQLTGDKRNGPVFVTIFSHSPKQLQST